MPVLRLITSPLRSAPPAECSTTTSSPTTGAEFTINKRLATWTTNANSKTYGDLDPVPLTTGSGHQFRRGRRRDGDLQPGCGRECQPADLSHHRYAQRHRCISTTTSSPTTGPSSLSTNGWPPGLPTPNSKTYGDLDPVPLTTGSGSNFVAADGVTATYSRAAGENASPPTYHITATLSATGDLNNYIITNDGAEFTINKRLATWTTNPNSKTYGDLDPVPLTTGSGSNFVAADGVTATYSTGCGRECQPADLSHHGHAERDRRVLEQLHHHQRWRRVHHQQTTGDLDHQCRPARPTAI